jgi:hypothetical protein
LPTLSVHLSTNGLIWFEPRTQRQPEKLWKLFKEQCSFTPSEKRVNAKAGILSALFSVECSPFTGG